MFRAKFQAMFWITLHLALFDFTCLGIGDGLVRDRFKVRLKHLTYIGWFWQASTEILASVLHCLRKPGGGTRASREEPRSETRGQRDLRSFRGTQAFPWKLPATAAGDMWPAILQRHDIGR